MCYADVFGPLPEPFGFPMAKVRNLDPRINDNRGWPPGFARLPAKKLAVRLRGRPLKGQLLWVVTHSLQVSHYQAHIKKVLRLIVLYSLNFYLGTLAYRWSCFSLDYRA